jgi:conjugative relaxase-like TrwC/TraI family protein
VVGVHGGVKFYRGSAAAARAYVEADHSRADDYYLAEGSGVATRYVVNVSDSVSLKHADELDGESYEQWVAGYDVTTGAAKGRLRDDPNALRFVEVVVNGPKTWSLAAALHPEVSAALDAAQDRAAEQIIAWLAEHATTRVGPRGRQVQVPVQQLEAAVIRHYTSRAGDPHRHLHLQVNARVFAEGRWRGLHSVGVRDMVAAINGIGHAAVATDPEFRAALAAHGFTLDAASGELVELAPYVGKFSARTAQIGRNLDRYEAEWRADHPGEEPGPRLRRAWDRHAWAEARPQKQKPTASAVDGVPNPPVDGAEMVAVWNRVLHELGYRDPVQPSQPSLPIPPAGPAVGSLDRDGAAALVISRLGAARSAWNAADLRGGVEEWIAATGLVADTSVRVELAEDITARAHALCVPLLDQPGVPEHVRSLTSQHVLDIEADLVAGMAQRATTPGTPATVDAHPYGLDETQCAAAATLAGTARLVVVEGAAGAGKTTTLAAVRHELERHGHRMVVVTPTLKAAHVAEKETSTEARSAAALAHEFGWRWDDDGHWTHQPTSGTSSADGLAGRPVLGSGDLLLVDEAGMLDQDTAHAVFAIAEQTGARVALVGDRHQLPAVGRGGVLDLAARWAHPDTVMGLDVVHRFAEPAYAEISLAMRRGVHAEEIFDQLVARGQISLHPTEVELLHAIAAETAERIAANRGGMGDVVVMADTLAQVTVLNGMVRDRLVATGHVDDAGAVVTSAGERIGVGDRVATRLNDHNLGVANRDLWTVTAINANGSITLTPAAHDRMAGSIGGAGVRDVPAWYVATRVELAYATTVYGAQGETTETGHMLIGETTTGSAAYVGMTRGRANNTAHIVAENLDEARAIWVGVMGRDRADLGPAHAATRAAEEMERYAPQRPVGVVLAKLKAAWTTQADLQARYDRLTSEREDLEAVIEIRKQYAPRHQELQAAARDGFERWAAADAARKTLDATIATEQRDVIASLRREWRHDQSQAYRAAAAMREGPGLLGIRRGQVRNARADLTAWAERWRPVLPDLSTEPDQIRHQLDRTAAGPDEDRVRHAITSYAARYVEQAHPEAPLIRAEKIAAAQAADDAEAALSAFDNDFADQLRPYGRTALCSRPGEVLDEVRGELDAVTRDLDAADQQVRSLTRAPEIRALPLGRLDAARNTWASDRQAAHQAAQQKARAAARERAAAETALLADSQRRESAVPRSPSPGHGPGIGF